MFIQEVELFKGIPSHIIDEIAELVTQESHPAGHVLFREGDFADYLYLFCWTVIAVSVLFFIPVSLSALWR